MIETNRRNGRKKYWTKETIINCFQNEILPNAESLKQSNIRKHHFYFYKAVENSIEITWSELYALSSLDYFEIKNEPSIWTRKKLIGYMEIIIQKGEQVNLTALSRNHEPFYKALKRSKSISEEDLYSACGLDYRKVNRQKRYKADDDARKKLIALTKIGIPLTRKFMDSALYHFLLERGDGSLERGIEKVDYKATKNRKIPNYRIDDKKFLVLLGHCFQDALSAIFSSLNEGIKDNNDKFGACVPDFIDKLSGDWYDAKLTTNSANQCIRDAKYHNTAEKVILVYLEKTAEIYSPLPDNVEVNNVEEYVSMVKGKFTKGFLMGRLYEIRRLIEHSIIGSKVTTQKSNLL